jgi:FKBP-type peptidyl-prolyl cis-trans isomerase (trigger factor)
VAENNFLVYNTLMADQKITSVVTKEDKGNVQIIFTLPWEMIKKAQDEALEHLGADIEVPGFRKGKAPKEKVKEKISINVLIEHALGHILPGALGDAMTEHKLKLAMYPKYELIKAEEGKDWEVKAISCELPEVKLGDYKKFLEKVEKKEDPILRALLENVKLDIPSVLIEEEANSRLSQLLERIEKLGLALESYLKSVGKTSQELRADYAKQAHDAISIDLILNAIALEQDIKVTKEEIDKAIEATGAKDQVPEERRILIESILKRQKALSQLTTSK